ncbi:hypothetical protein ACCO45_007202 [Purpureocillium lilacinum]|uniref:Uncharacterized protein n=1 Tax=Purpureocillium lilacinum TaxID=33203 RepID=A0ACC4DRP9_PURLI
MGSSSSKSSMAAGAARKFPHRAAGMTPPPRAPSRVVGQPDKAGRVKNKSTPNCTGNGQPTDVLTATGVEADGMDPDFTPGSGFSQRLHQMGVVQPNPTFSPSSTATGPERGGSAPLFPTSRAVNSTLSVLDARQALQLQADQDLENMGRSGYRGRRLLDMRTVLDVIHMRERAVPPAPSNRDWAWSLGWRTSLAATGYCPMYQPAGRAIRQRPVHALPKSRVFLASPFVVANTPESDSGGFPLDRYYDYNPGLHPPLQEYMLRRRVRQ